MRFVLIYCCLTLAACAEYDVKVNEQVVYSPPKLFLDFSLPDESLQVCVQQTIEDQRITKPEQLTQLACTNGDIRSVAGIELFNKLTQLNLNNNALQDIDALGDLPALQTLLLAANKIKTMTALRESTALVQLNVENNTDLNCATVIELMDQRPALRARLPEHCVEKLK